MLDENLVVEDLPEVQIKCSSCSKPLMNVKVYVKNAPISHKIKASCPFCGDESFVKDFSGMILIGPVGKDQSNNYTIIADIDMRADGVSFFKIQKGT